MTSKSLILVAGLTATLALGGCDQVKKLVGGGAPKGQVAATVAGDEITTLEVRQEMGGFTSRDPKVMKQAEQAALQRIILRRLIVAQAKEQKLDKTPEYTLQVKRGEEALLTQLYQRKIATSIAVPSRDEAAAFVAANPDRFANRQIYVVDQLVVGPNKVPPDQLRPLKTLDEVRALFEREGVTYQGTTATLDSLSADQRLIAEIKKLPPGEVFILPQAGGSLLFNRIVETKSAPFQGDMAVNFATNVLRQQKAQEAVVRQVELLRKSSDSKITYNDAFKPPADAKGAAPAAAAPAAAAPAAPAAKP